MTKIIASGISKSLKTNEVAEIRNTLGVNTYQELGLELPTSVEPTLISKFDKNEHKVYEQYGLTPKQITEQYNVTRSSTGTYVDATGKVRIAGVNEPRITYDPETGKCLGLLVEEQRTNLLTWSEDLTNSAWLRSNTGGNVVALIDNPLLDKPYNKVQFSEVGTGINTNRFVAHGTEIAITVQLRQAELRYVIIRLNASKDVRCTVDLSNGSTQTNNVSDVSVKKLADGSYIISVAATGLTAASSSFQLVSTGGAGVGITTVTGSIGDGFLVGFAQLEAASTSSSYIPTQASAVTRASDNVFRVLGSEFNSERGAIYLECDLLAIPYINGARLLSLYRFNLTTCVDIEVRDSGIMRLNIGVGSQVVSFPIVNNTLSKNKLVISWDGRSVTLARNGLTITGTLNNDFTIFLSLHLGKRGDGVAYLPSCFKDLRYYPKALSQAEAINLTKV